MARKSVKGYAEKNYYDNTKFSGGIVATNDPLNEGSFKHLVNFDIADTGQSLTPRKGFLTTAFKYKQDGIDVEVALSDKTTYYFDANIGKWIFVDFGTYDTFVDNNNNTIYTPKMYKVEFDIENKYITNVQTIKNFSVSGITITPWLYDIDEGYLTSIEIFNNMEYTDTNYAVPAIDEYGVTKYIIKVGYKSQHDVYEYCWLTLTYREDQTEYEGVTYPSDTLILSCLDNTDIVNTVDPNYRNLASYKSIIPDPMQVIYENGKEPLGFIQQFPMIYIKHKNKYLINNTQVIEGLEIVPNFYLKELENNTYVDNSTSTPILNAPKYEWAYTYDIVSTSQDNIILTDTLVYRSPIYSLEDNSVLLSTYPIESTIIERINDMSSKIYSLYNIPMHDGVAWSTIAHTTFNTWEYSEYEDYLNEFDTLTNELTETYRKSTLILYVVPKPTMTKRIKMPTAMFNIGDNIELMQTAWYNNSTYNMKEDSLYNLPGITETMVCNDGEKLSDKFSSIDFSKESYIEDKDDSTSIYNYITKKYSIYSGSNCEPLNNNINKNLKDAISNYLENNNNILSNKDLINLIKSSETSDERFWFYVRPLSEVVHDFSTNTEGLGYSYMVQTALHSNIIAFKYAGMTYSELEEYLTDTAFDNVLIKYFEKVSIVDVPQGVKTSNKHTLALSKLFPNLLEYDNTYYVYFDKKTHETSIDINKTFSSTEYRTDSILNNFAVVSAYDDNDNLINYIDPSILTFLPHIKNIPLSAYEINTNALAIAKDNLFSISNNMLSAELTRTNTTYEYLKKLGMFDQGLNINMYILHMPTLSYLKQEYPNFNSYTRDYFVNTTSLIQNRLITIDSKQPTTYVEYLTEEPRQIENAKDYFIFNSSLGAHLVTYNENKIFISKENMQYYFPATGYSFSFPETIVKAIQYKDMILVFTTQNLYAVYLTEYVTTVQNGTDDQGNPKYVQQSTYEFATLPVLYNLMVDERYKDAIQVYNQMILFYSADGQMFLIKPTAAIDSNTRFSIQYFNKSANDILLNYKEYMQDRLYVYGKSDIITDVNIKVSTSINFIKVFYSAPNIMTYILIYDIINNRWYTYDTLMFTNIKGLHNIPSGEMYTIEDNNKLYFTLPYIQPNEVDNNVDMASYNNFSREAIRSEIDTGTINLNNHLKKRFKDLHVIYKNLNASAIEFSLDTFIDDIPITTYIGSSLEVRNVAGSDTIVLVEENKVINFLEDNTALFNFLDYNSNKIITHRNNIISKGKSIRTKMYFTSKGKYKIQGYGLVYKEHTV